MTNSYKGWKNYETWNVVLWITNDEVLYKLALNSSNYKDFIKKVKKVNYKNTQDCTPNKVEWSNKKIDVVSIDQLIKDLK